MNWDALGALGEIVGAVAVVLTVAYLAIQIRQSGKTSTQQSYHDLVTRRSDWFNRQIESNEVTAIFVAGMRGDSLNEIEAERFTAAMLNFASHVQDVYLQGRNGLVEENVWLAERQFFAACKGLPGFIGWWRAATQYFLPEFVAEVETIEPIPIVLMDQESGEWTRGTW